MTNGTGGLEGGRDVLSHVDMERESTLPSLGETLSVWTKLSSASCSAASASPTADRAETIGLLATSAFVTSVSSLEAATSCRTRISVIRRADEKWSSADGDAVGPLPEANRLNLRQNLILRQKLSHFETKTALRSFVRRRTKGQRPHFGRKSPVTDDGMEPAQAGSPTSSVGHEPGHEPKEEPPC
jgi:hypothetical protein